MSFPTNNPELGNGLPGQGQPPALPQEPVSHATMLAESDPLLAEYIQNGTSALERLRADFAAQQAEMATLQQQAQQQAQQPAQPLAPPPVPPPAASPFTAEALATALQARLGPILQQLSSRSAPQEKENNIKLSPPDTFDGTDATKLKNFLGFLNLQFETQPISFNSEIKKVNFAVSYLRGIPSQEVLLELQKPYDERVSWLHTFAAFAKHIKEQYGRKDERTVARQKIRKLEQRGSVAKYYVEFMTLAPLTGWNDQGQYDAFYEGLKEEIKDRLSLRDDPPESFLDLKDAAITADNRIYERNNERRNKNNSSSDKSNNDSNKNKDKDNKKNNNNNNNRSDQSRNSSKGNNDKVKFVPPPTDPANPSAGPAPMDIDATKVRYAPLNQAQKDYRRTHNLCLYCGGKHKLDDCDKRRNNGRTASVSAATVSPQPRTPAQAASVSFSVSGPSGNPNA